MNNTTGMTPEAIGWFHYARQLQNSSSASQRSKDAGERNKWVGPYAAVRRARGASNMWLSSEGRLYDAERRAGALVDALAAMRCNRRGITSGALCWRIASAVWYLAQLRRCERRCKATVEAQEATQRFSRIIRHLLNIVPQLNDSID